MIILVKKSSRFSLFLEWDLLFWNEIPRDLQSNNFFFSHKHFHLSRLNRSFIEMWRPFLFNESAAKERDKGMEHHIGDSDSEN